MFSAPGYSGTEREQPRAGATSYAAAAQLPNMSRPPPNIKRDNGDNTFHGGESPVSLIDIPFFSESLDARDAGSRFSCLHCHLGEQHELHSARFEGRT